MFFCLIFCEISKSKVLNLPIFCFTNFWCQVNGKKARSRLAKEPVCNVCNLKKVQLVNWASESSQILRFGSINLFRYLQFFNCVCTIVPLSIQKWNVLNAIWNQMRDKNVLNITFNSAQSPLYGILVHTAFTMKMEDLYSRLLFRKDSRPAIPMWVF